MKYEVKDRWDGKILYADEAESFKALIVAAVKAKANLYGANLYGANLDGANLVRANLDGANLYGATGIHGFFCFGPGGSRKSYAWARWEAKGYIVHCGCQNLTLKKFAEAVKEKHGDNPHGKYYMAMVGVMELISSESKAAYQESETARKAKAAA